MEEPALQTGRILIVDDQVDNVALLERLLTRRGYLDFRSTTDSRQVAELSRSFDPDLVLLDLQMPYVDGFTVLEQLRVRPYRESLLPVLVLTADTTPETKRRALAAGANDFLHKPFDPTEVMLRVRNLLAIRFLQKHLEEKNRLLEYASRAKSEFLANMSHELRTPLNAIIGFSELMLDESMPLEEDSRRQFLENILGSGRHLLHLINDILDLSKVEAGKMEMHPEPFHVGEAVQSVHTVVGALTRKKQQELVLELDPAVGLAVLDPARFKQVLFNLLSNAVKFTPERGRISTSIQLGGGETLEVSVKDTGIGIRPEDVPLIFQEFQQLHTGYGRQQQGTGLGLALVRRFVEMMGGSVQVESEPGVGTTITVNLPLRQNE
jgi:signal transduction histidine kinase